MRQMWAYPDGYIHPGKCRCHTMKISVVSRQYQLLSEWLKEVCHVRGGIRTHRVEKVKVWHGDVLPIYADHGDERTVFEVELMGNCQKHIINFEDVPKLTNGNQYVVPARKRENE